MVEILVSYMAWQVAACMDKQLAVVDSAEDAAGAVNTVVAGAVNTAEVEHSIAVGHKMMMMMMTTMASRPPSFCLRSSPQDTPP